MRVGFLIDRWDPARGGAEHALAALARRLEARGHEVVAVCLAAAAGAPGRPAPLATPAALALLPRTRRERWLARALEERAGAERCDVTVGLRHLAAVDLWWPHGGSHLQALAASARARGRSAPAAPRGRHRLFVALEERLLAGGARRIACVSPRVRDELLERCPAAAGRLVLVRNGVDRVRFDPARRAALGPALRARLGLGGEPLLVHLARDPRAKGLPVLLDALARLGARPWTLVVAGPRRPGRWRRAARRAGLARGRVHVAAELPADALLAAADLCVQPTWRDTSGLVLLEALASGVPAVTTSAAGEAELCHEPGRGAVVEPGDAEALARALAGWLERVEAGAVDRAHVRAATRERAEAAWLDRMEALVLALAPGGAKV